MASNKDNLPWSNKSGFHDLFNHMDSFLNESIRNFDSFFNLKSFDVNMYETNEDIIVEAYLPGIKRDQIELEIIGNRLRIAAEDMTILEEKNDKTKYNDRRQSFQKTERLITLPFHVSEKETKASFHKDTLKVSIPKRNSGRKFIDIDT
ncbi:Hsp20/alpha crystallin family protein [Virgibacillus sp. YIM 98842]|jgi:HSP20 family protein|uniref:Hsp20/alpha crystallin family protein n=1 Tax=Virgibacillus sp. YIM 98842 TaxID=2663533 RepID=UPI0013DCCDD3|nr:Hsp20/alpha crystallin family protein [Virgibacillus sp. YIM 98842]